MHEDYFAPLGFATEPIEVRRRWITRIFTLVLIIFIAWLFLTKVVRPPTEEPAVGPKPVETLPAPK